MPLAFGLPYASYSANAASVGDKLTESKFAKGEINGGKSEYAYLLEWDEFFAPRAVYELMDAGVILKVASNQFEIAVENGSKKFDYGTISIPVKMQRLDSDKLYDLLKSVAEKNYLKFYGVKTGNVSSGSDLGSSKMITLSKPTIAMLVGTGVNATDAGEVWHLLDQRMNIPSTHLEIATFNRVDLGRYNTIIMVGGGYGDLNKEKLRNWVQAGGTLVLTEEAVRQCQNPCPVLFLAVEFFDFEIQTTKLMNGPE